MFHPLARAQSVVNDEHTGRNPLWVTGESMSRVRWAVTLLLAWHITAMVADAVPAPADVPLVESIRHPTGDPVRGRVTPILDILTANLARVHQAIWPAVSLTRQLTDRYMEGLGLKQRWRMFSNPPRYDEYLRVRYYVAVGPGDDTGVWIANELVLPAHREDRIRTFQSFRDSYRDKALVIALGRFHGSPEVANGEATERHEALAPVARYFARRFVRARLAGDGDRLLRVELWHGIAESGSRASGPLSERRARMSARLTELSEYYHGPVEMSLRGGPYPAYQGTEQESDIFWTLDYIEEL